ncbi:hypothetical protein D3C86_1863070 [compost metagenome]
MLKEANVDISQEDALDDTLFMAAMECGLQGSDQHKLVIALTKKYPELVPQAIEHLEEDNKGLQILFESRRGEEPDYAEQIYQLIVDKEAFLDFDCVELLEGVLDTYAASLLSADANNLM